ncbi:PH and SEC7 domain-containing protein 1 isoform X2 [Callorhinchus milii]|uniref:Pleckstrin and Sec7 domain containing a n=1 Tax=Callorhinchus milii TaxID=7868 RepID=A0A4W3GK63_CALMI|nr:PH and SEC7 domain-containing protein 1 isoform X2 [Callorhinchus milii]|eukprot:gi/632936663/ref/XP_007895645.1/ PREDICTED: PH and SEC7 domain-containing protein 1-like isoform X2 [Callorhinchus milii]
MSLHVELRTGSSSSSASRSPERQHVASPNKLNPTRSDVTIKSQCRLSPNPIVRRSHVQRRSLPSNTKMDFLGFPDSKKSTVSLIRTRSETNPLCEKFPTSPGRSTAPTSPVCIRTKPFCPLNVNNTKAVSGFGPEGKSSVVTFSYIEKARVKTVNPFSVSVLPQQAKITASGQHSCIGRKSPQTGPKVQQGVATKIVHTRSLDTETNSMTATTLHRPSSDNGLASTQGSNPSEGREISKSLCDKQADPCVWLGEHSELAQRIAKARREFFYGILEPQFKANAKNEHSPTDVATNETRENNLKVHSTDGPSGEQQHSVKESSTEISVVKATSSSNGTSRESEPRTTRANKYSETDLDAAPIRCYQETNLDEVMAEDNVTSPELPGQSSSIHHSTNPDDSAQIDRDVDFVSRLPAGTTGNLHEYGDKLNSDAAGDEVFSQPESATDNRSPDRDVKNMLPSIASIYIVRRLSEDGTDTFSKQFERILESHRAKGTSYTSLDSVDVLSSPARNHENYFTFDLPTLTPAIQEQIKESARLIEQNFLPCAHAHDESCATSTHGSDWPGSPRRKEIRAQRNQNVSPMVVYSKSENLLTRCQLYREDNFIKVEIEDNDERKSDFSSSDGNLNHLTTDTESEMDSTEQLALGSTDTLANGNKSDLDAAKRLARRLYNLDGFKKSDVARHLGKNNDFSKMVAEEYLRFFDFTGMSLDQALRAFLKEFALMGETQERERVLIHFSHRYHQCNPGKISAEDGIHTLTCALMLLNTDLHGHNIGKRMSCSEFIGNLEGLNDGKDFPKDLLKVLYSSIKNEKLQWTINEEELRKSLSELADDRTDPSLKAMKRISSGSNPFLDIMQDPNAATYKHGFLVRKVHADSDGKKTPRGKRGWKTFYAVLKGMILYLQKDEYKSDKQLSDEDLKNAISIHHSLAERASDYKKSNVFYLKTADWRIFLFQAPSPEMMQSWITRINLVTGMFSAPPFPAAIGSQKKFSRPLLPTTTTRLSLEEQVKAHEARLKSMTVDLAEHHSYPPDKKVKGKELEEYRQKEDYLEFEKVRFSTYVLLLCAKLKAGTDDLDKFESTLFDTVESEGNGLKKSRSSPSLNPEQPIITIRVKRNTSERRSYRQAISTKHKL